VRELINRGHNVVVCEPEDSWSLSNLIADHGTQPIEEFKQYYPNLKSVLYIPDEALDPAILQDADLVIVHEWNDPSLVEMIGTLKERYGYKLLFHDTHHRAVSDSESMAKYNFDNYDGALVFGEVIKGIYQQRKWIQNVWTWHEAADTELFKPHPEVEKEGDLVWIGNWGDDERKDELQEFLIKPVKDLGLKAKVYGVRYPEAALQALKDAGIEYGGWLPNYKAPEVFAKYKLTVHVPRGPYVKMLPGIPTIRPFEALACGIPLISAPWNDVEGLFSDGDYLTVANGKDMKATMQIVLHEKGVAEVLAENGRNTILQRHTCGHRVDELEIIMGELGFTESAIYPLQKKILEK
jgi:spore maturation protein CgeB